MSLKKAQKAAVEDGNGASWFRRLRRSKFLVTLVVFVAMMLDLIMMTTLEPILPDILYQMDGVRSVAVVSETRNASAAAPVRTQTDDGADPLLPVGHALSFFAVRSTVMRGDEFTSHRVLSVSHEVGAVLATKPAVEVLANLLVGSFVDRVGHQYPMVLGCLLNLGATCAFAFASRFWMLIVARAVQAVGSSLSVVSGLAMIACVFTDQKERSRANSIAFGGLSLGVILGLPFGAISYQYFGKTVPFLILAGLMFVDGLLRLLLDVPDNARDPERKSAGGQLQSILTDPYVVVALACNVVTHVGFGVLVATEPAWMQQRRHAEPVQIGIVLVVGALLQFFAQLVSGVFSNGKRWRFCLMGMFLLGLAFYGYPLTWNVWSVLLPECVARSGLGLFLASLSPLLSYIADIRHSSNYGAMFGLYAASYNLGLVVGPLCGGLLLRFVAFETLYFATGTVGILSAFLCLVFRSLEAQNLELYDAMIDDDEKTDKKVAA